MNSVFKTAFKFITEILKPSQLFFIASKNEQKAKWFAQSNRHSDYVRELSGYEELLGEETVYWGRLSLKTFLNKPVCFPGHLRLGGSGLRELSRRRAPSASSPSTDGIQTTCLHCHREVAVSSIFWQILQPRHKMKCIWSK